MALLWLMAACGTTVTETRSTADAGAATTDAPPLDAPPLDPCDPGRVVDLDRAGIATSHGLSAVVDLRASPVGRFAADDPSCRPVDRPVVLRMRAQQTGRVVVNVADTDGAALVVRRLERCERGGGLVRCAPSPCDAATPCNPWVLGDVVAGEQIDFAVGLEEAAPTGFAVPASQAAVSVVIFPTLAPGAPCHRDERGDDLCGPALTCDRLHDTQRCVPAGGLGEQCNPWLRQCAAGQRCGSTCHTPLPVGAPCEPDSRTSGCAPGSTCAPRDGTHVCVPHGSLDASCRNERTATSPCDEGLICRNSGCRPANNVAGPCDINRPCAATSRCVSGRCVPPGQLDGPCGREGGRLSCDDGLACNGNTGVCLPEIAEGEACRPVVTIDDRACADGFTCANGRCARIGRAGDRCGDLNYQRDCTLPLWCVDGVCAEAASEGRPCDDDARCDGGQRCFEGRCRASGVFGGPCRAQAPGCDAGLWCHEGRCANATPPGTRCYSGQPCTPPLACLEAVVGFLTACHPPPVACDKGCPEGRVCREGECVVEGRCDRPGSLAPQPCGEGRHCMSQADETVACRSDGVRGGRCRPDTTAPCDAGLACFHGQCVPVQPDGGACDLRLRYHGICGPGLRCVAPDSCREPDCTWWFGMGQPGVCRAFPAAGSVGGQCVRASDGTGRCDATLFCDPQTLRCAAPPSTDRPCTEDHPANLCPPDSRCLLQVNRGRVCVPAGALGQRCRMGPIGQCDPGLGCGSDGLCHHVVREGDPCNVSPRVECPPGTACLVTAGRTSRCFRDGSEGAPCGRDSGTRTTCETGLTCIAGVCGRAP